MGSLGGGSRLTRLVLRAAKLAPGRLRIPNEVAKHARVARVVPGEALEVLNLQGTIGQGKLLTWNADGSCEVEIQHLLYDRGEPPYPLILALAILHTEAFDWAVEKATELGATGIVPVISARVQGRRHHHRTSRWQRVAEAATAQCGRSRIPQVRPPTLLMDFLACCTGLVVVADFAGGTSVKAGAEIHRGVTVLVGPEGGFTQEEREALRRFGTSSIFLGPRTLRAETAAIVALGLVQNQLGWWTR